MTAPGRFKTRWRWTPPVLLAARHFLQEDQAPAVATDVANLAHQEQSTGAAMLRVAP